VFSCFGHFDHRTNLPKVRCGKMVKKSTLASRFWRACGGRRLMLYSGHISCMLGLGGLVEGGAEG